MSGDAALDGIDDRDIPKMEFLSAAFSSDHEKIAQLMRNGRVHIDSTDDDGVTVLHIAASMGNDRLVRLFLDYGANIEAANQLGMTAFHHAAREGKLAVIDILLQRGANYSKLTALGVNALTLASAGGHADVVKKLLSLRDETMKSAPRNRSLAPSPLIAATCYKSSQICNYLTRAGAKIDETIDTLKGLSALSTAIICTPGVYMVTSLLDLGANHAKRSLCRKTALELAKYYKRNDIENVFYEKRAPRKLEAEYDTRKVIADDQIPDRIDQQAQDGSTLLMFAATVRSVNAAKQLLERDVYVNAKDNMHINALQIAAMLRVDDIIQLLLINKARTSESNKYGQTAYDLLLRSADVLDPANLRAQLHCHRPMEIDLKLNLSSSSSSLYKTLQPKGWFNKVSSQIFLTPVERPMEAIEPRHWLDAITRYQPSRDRNSCKFACVEEILRGTKSARAHEGNSYDMTTDAMKVLMEECHSFQVISFCDIYGEREEQQRSQSQSSSHQFSQFYDVAQYHAQSLGYTNAKKPVPKNVINLPRRDSMDSTGSLTERRKPRTMSMVDAPSQNQSRTTPRMIKKSKDTTMVAESSLSSQMQYGRFNRTSSVPTVSVAPPVRPLRHQVMAQSNGQSIMDLIWTQFIIRNQRELMIKLQNAEIDRHIFPSLCEKDIIEITGSADDWFIVREIQHTLQQQLRLGTL